MQAGLVGYDPLRRSTCWFTSKLPSNGILVLFFHPGEMEPTSPPTWLLHILIPFFIIVLTFIPTIIVLRKQLYQKLYFGKGKLVLVMITK